MSENWKIGDMAIAICNIYLLPSPWDPSEKTKTLVTKDEEFFVRDLKKLDCLDLLDIGINGNPFNRIDYDCDICHKTHLAKRESDQNIYFPSIAFVKPEKNSLKERIKRAFKWKKKKDHPDIFLTPKQTPERKPPREIPHKIHEKERLKETVESTFD